MEPLPKKRPRRSNSSDALTDSARLKRQHLEEAPVAAPKASGRWADDLLALADHVASRLAAKTLPTNIDLQYDVTTP